MGDFQELQRLQEKWEDVDKSDCADVFRDYIEVSQNLFDEMFQEMVETGDDFALLLYRKRFLCAVLEKIKERAEPREWESSSEVYRLAEGALEMVDDLETGHSFHDFIDEENDDNE